MKAKRDSKERKAAKPVAKEKANAGVELDDNALGEITGGVRDIATGQATGKRSHKPFTIVKQFDKSTPSLG